MVEQDAQLNLAFRALGDASRRRILHLLREAGELRVGDVAAAFEMSLNGVSKHLKVLERAGLVARRVAGKTHWIRPEPTGLAAAFEWLHAEHHYWSTRLDALAQHLATTESS